MSDTTPHPNRFAGKVAVVTGAASGIGRETALRLGAEGASVIAVDIAADVDGVAAQIVEAGGTALAVQSDVSERAGAEAPVDAALDEYGQLDVLCNIAGILAAAHSDQVPDEQWERIIAVNLTGVFYTTRRALPALVESKGSIVMAASTSALSGHPWMTAYSASKGGVLAMTRTLAMEYARRGVRVNAVAPGGITTPMVGGLQLPDDIDFSLFDRISPLDEFRGPETVASAICFLAAPEAAHINGEVLRVDGGTLA
ncbi:MAG: SDR family NAD(P)-dependent oxidoreductase [Acidimicrobiales bacterium]|jgi:NAD(P)-dependent dehydrogenase (short-subunit alcohol dehydrogenase family)|nr:SDR family NAD(P)-dependent oxidoreductase [Acidimicrobiales bacterium]